MLDDRRVCVSKVAEALRISETKVRKIFIESYGCKSCTAAFTEFCNAHQSKCADQLRSNVWTVLKEIQPISTLDLALSEFYLLANFKLFLDDVLDPMDKLTRPK